MSEETRAESEARHELAVPGPLAERPMLGYDIARASSLEIDPLFAALGRCAAGELAVAGRQGAPYRLSDRGDAELKRRLLFGPPRPPTAPGR
jgi:hypothetical protein